MTALTSARLVLTGHPLQRCGARAVAELARVKDVADVTAGDLDAVADALTRAVADAAVAPGGAAYDWWKVLFALYPNSPATHSKRSRDRGQLTTVIGRLLAPDREGAAGWARQVQALGLAGLWAHASPETVTLGALREHGRGAVVGTTLWMFKNDNQEPWLRVTSARGGIPSFIRVLFADPECRAGWGALQRVLTERDKDGGIRASGVAAAARTLFDPADRPGAMAGDRLPRELLRLSRDPGQRTGRTLATWRALCRLYLEVIHQMDAGQVKPASDLITAWITQEPNPRGRFNEYVGAAGRAFELQKLMMRAAARLMLDGHKPADVSAVAPALFATDGNGWRLRGLLYFDVMAGLVNRGVEIGRTPRPGEPEDDAAEPRFDPPIVDPDSWGSSS